MKTFLLSLILVGLFLSPAQLDASDDITEKLITLRLYRGSRLIKETSAQEVTVAVQFRPLFIGQLFQTITVSDEQKELQHIFNLKEVTLLEQNQMVWNKNGKRRNPLPTQATTIIRDDSVSKPFHIRLKPLEKTNVFSVTVSKGEEPGKMNQLLESELTLPPGQSVVLGFEDRQKQTYFVSFNRSKEELSLPREMSEKIITIDKAPRLIFHPAPEYPQEAIAQSVQGIVLLTATLDENGSIAQIQTESGHALLIPAAVEAVKKWRYEPFYLNGKAIPVRFAVKVDFKLPGETMPSADTMPNIWPTQGLLTSGFGPRRHPISGKNDFHNGQDIAARLGTPVVATADGVVTFAGVKGARGKTVVIDHGNGFTTVYAQLNEIRIQVNASVKRNTTIGTVGKSGLATGPHLHYEIHKDGQAVNPLDFIIR